MKVRDLHAQPLESQQQPSPDHHDLYRQTAAAIADDCWSIDPAWLLDRPEVYEQIKELDEQLTTMEHTGASEPAYRATLDRLVSCVHDARAAYEQEQEQAKERAWQ